MAELTKEILVKIFNDVVVNQYHVPHDHPFDSSLEDHHAGVADNFVEEVYEAGDIIFEQDEEKQKNIDQQQSIIIEIVKQLESSESANDDFDLELGEYKRLFKEFCDYTIDRIGGGG